MVNDPFIIHFGFSLVHVALVMVPSVLLSLHVISFLLSNSLVLFVISIVFIVLRLDAVISPSGVFLISPEKSVFFSALCVSFVLSFWYMLINKLWTSFHPHLAVVNNWLKASSFKATNTMTISFKETHLEVSNQCFIMMILSSKFIFHFFSLVPWGHWVCPVSFLTLLKTGYG